MQYKLGILLLISVLLLTSCNSTVCMLNDANIQTEEVAPSTEESPTYEQLSSENERLKKLLKDNDIYDKERHPLDIEFEKAFSDEVKVDTLKVRATLQTYAKKWEEEMNKYIVLLTEKLDDDKLKWLTEAQSKWKESKSADDELYVQCYVQQIGEGSLIKDVMASKNYRDYRARALYLKETYNIIKTENQ